jgi:hypothetical protein
MRGEIGILFWSAETMANVLGSARIPLDRLEFLAGPVVQAELGVRRVGQVVIVTRGLLKRRS